MAGYRPLMTALLVIRGMNLARKRFVELHLELHLDGYVHVSEWIYSQCSNQSQGLHLMVV